MKTKKTPLTLSITLHLSSQEDSYSIVSIVNYEKKIQLVLNSDAPKRKIIDFVEGEVDQLLSETSRAIHHSPLLTDGEVASKEEESK